jgi:hypothetical protein
MQNAECRIREICGGKLLSPTLSSTDLWRRGRRGAELEGGSPPREREKTREASPDEAGLNKNGRFLVGSL